MKLSKKHNMCSTITLLSFLLTSLCLVTSKAKRFDIDGSFGHADEFDDDIPQLIEINKEDLIEINQKPGKVKPKPDFGLPMFPQLPHSLGLSSSWNFGTSLGSSYAPLMQAQRPPSSSSPNGPYHSPATSDELYLTPPTQTGMFQSQNFRPPSRPQPTISSNSLIEYINEHNGWTTQPVQQSTPSFLQQQQSPSPQPPQSLPVTSSQSPSFSVQTPSANAQAISGPLSIEELITQTPSSSWSQPPSVQNSQPPPQQYQPSKPFSFYEQLYLHLLEPQAWEKVQDSTDQWHHQLPQQNTFHKPQQSQQQQFEQTNFGLPVKPISSAPVFYLTMPTMTNLTDSTANLYNTTGIGNSNSNVISAVLNPIVDDMTDYTLPGQSPLPQYSNTDITVDDDKFFDSGDDFVSIDNDEDEMMQMVE